MAIALPALRPLLLAALLALAAGPARAGNDAITPFLGTYIGTAEVLDASNAVVEQREMDVTIAAADDDGFVITWVNVTLVNGRRDVPGVARRVQRVTFHPGEQPGIYVEDTRGSLFQRRREMNLLNGDPLRWAQISGNSLGVYSLVLMDDGRYELQRYDRILTDVGLDIAYDRIVEGVVERRITGRTIRVSEPDPTSQE